MEGVLEQQRTLHEERERLMELMAREMVKKKAGYREQLNSDHRVRLMMDRYTESTNKLADYYEGDTFD